MTNIRLKPKEVQMYALITLVCFLIMLLSILNDSGLFIVIFRYFFEDGYHQLLVEESLITGIAVPNNVFELISQFFKYSRFEFDPMIIFGTQWFQVVIPLFATIPALLFYEEFYSIKLFEFHKFKKYQSTVLKEMMQKSLLLGFSIFNAFLLYFLFVLFISKGRFNESVTRSLFEDLLGKGFYQKHVYSYHEVLPVK